MGNNSWHSTSKATRERQRDERLGEERINNRGYLMKIIEYNNTSDITVEFQDKYKGIVKARYNEFAKGIIKNPYQPNIYGGMIGSKYPAKIGNKVSKEYFTWRNMLVECSNNGRDVCCDEWMFFENFYEWLHSQENFKQWLENDKWSLNKDIIADNNIYSPNTCYLVPLKVKKEFIKQELNTDGVSEKVLNEYKKYKEKKIQQVAEEELANGNITKECYDTMMKYEVVIDGS